MLKLTGFFSSVRRMPLSSPSDTHSCLLGVSDMIETLFKSLSSRKLDHLGNGVISFAIMMLSMYSPSRVFAFGKQPTSVYPTFPYMWRALSFVA